VPSFKKIQPKTNRFSFLPPAPLLTSLRVEFWKTLS